MFTLSAKSLERLEGVHPDLVKIVKRAIEVTKVDFGVTEGLRTYSRQKQLVSEGKSLTMNSRHLTGHAVDLVAYVDGKVSWETTQYKLINDAMQQAAKELGIPIVWGGSWKTLVDGPHFELLRTAYPA